MGVSAGVAAFIYCPNKQSALKKHTETMINGEEQYSFKTEETPQNVKIKKV